MLRTQLAQLRQLVRLALEELKEGEGWSQSHCGREADRKSKTRREVPSLLLSPSNIPLGLPVCRNLQEASWQKSLGHKNVGTKYGGLILELRKDRSITSSTFLIQLTF